MRLLYRLLERSSEYLYYVPNFLVVLAICRFYEMLTYWNHLNALPVRYSKENRLAEARQHVLPLTFIKDSITSIKKIRNSFNLCYFIRNVEASISSKENRAKENGFKVVVPAGNWTWISRLTHSLKRDDLAAHLKGEKCLKISPLCQTIFVWVLHRVNMQVCRL